MLRHGPWVSEAGMSACSSWKSGQKTTQSPRHTPVRPWLRMTAYVRLGKFPKGIPVCLTVLRHIRHEEGKE